MRDRSDDPHDFLDTRPFREHQERLHTQWGRPRAHYTPNRVPAAHRVLLALLSTTWIAWALIGLLSGHMFVWALIVPLHLTGPAAWLLSGAALASAAACCVTLVDHVDRRDNEHHYQQAKRQLWRAAGALALVSGLTHAATALGWLPPMPAAFHGVSAGTLLAWLQQPALQGWMTRHHDLIHTAWWVTGGWAFLGLAVFHRMGWLEVDAQQPRSGGGFFIATWSMILPFLAAVALRLLDDLVMGRLAPTIDTPDDLMAPWAWSLTLLLTCLSLAALLAFVTVCQALQQLGWMKVHCPS